MEIIILSTYGLGWLVCARILYRRWRHRTWVYECCHCAHKARGMSDARAAAAAMVASLVWWLMLLTALVRVDRPKLPAIRHRHDDSRVASAEIEIYGERKT